MGKLKLAAAILLPLLFIALGLYRYYLHTPSPVFPELNGNYTSGSVSHDGLERTYNLYTPSSLTDKPALLLVLHGSMSNGNMMRDMTGWEFDQLADRNNLVVAYPDGYQRHWNDCRKSASYAANTENIDDVGFLTALAKHINDTHSIDPNRVFATGLSNGGHMTYRLAMEAPEVFAAYASFAANLPAAENLGCTPVGKAVPMAIFSGTEDPVNPYDGGLVTILGDDSRGEVLSAQQTFAYWKDLAASDGKIEKFVHPDSDGITDTRVIEQRWNTGQRNEVRLYTLEGSGHVIPSTRIEYPRMTGRAAKDISGAEQVLAFFFRTADK